MKKIITAAIFVSLPSSVFAADVYQPMPVWTGFYLGVNGGYDTGAWAGDFTYEGKVDPGFLPAKTVSASGIFGGGQIGYNQQFSALVVGLEADIDSGNFGGKDSFNYNSTCCTPAVPVFTKDASFNLDYFGTLRGRVGYSLGGFMPYFTGGLAWGHTQSHVTVFNNWAISGGYWTGPSATGSVSEDNVGWTIGGGVEYAVASHWSVKAEYLYIDLGTEGYNWIGTCTPAAGCTKNVFNTDGLRSDLTFSIARLGVNYRF